MADATVTIKVKPIELKIIVDALRERDADLLCKIQAAQGAEMRRLRAIQESLRTLINDLS